MTHEIAIELVDALRSIGSRVRIKACDAGLSDWDRPLFSPVRGYLETGKSGPLLLAAIEFIEIERGEQKHLGRLIPPLTVDHGTYIESTLTKLGVGFESRGGDFRVRNEEA